MKPLRDMILICRNENQAERFFNGVYIPETTKNPRNQVAYHATVLAHGPKAEHAITGTTVVVSEHAGETEVIHEGKKCLLMRERDIIGVVDS